MRKVLWSKLGRIASASVVWVAASALGTGCSSGSSGDEAATASEMATATVSGAVSSGAQGKLAGVSGRLNSILGLVPSAWAASSCPVAATGVEGLDCSVDAAGKSMTLAYRSCNFGNNSAVWEGSLILTSSGSVSCGTVPSEAAGATLSRSFGPQTTRTIGNSVHVSSLDTTTPSGFETPVSGGSLTTYVSPTRRTLAINGIHLLSQKIFRGNGNTGRVRTEVDHTVSTAVDSPLELVVTQEHGSGSGTLQVSGTVIVQHNVAKYTGTSVFKDVDYVPGCCHPQSGTVTTTLSGSRTGTETLEFSASECGSAKLKSENGEENALTLSRCF